MAHQAKKVYKTGEDLVQLNQMIKDIEEAVAEFSNQIDELETKIKAQNEQVAEMSAQLVQKEQEKKQMEIKMDEVQNVKSSLESKIEEDRRNFEKELQKMIDKQKHAEWGWYTCSLVSWHTAVVLDAFIIEISWEQVQGREEKVREWNAKDEDRNEAEWGKNMDLY